MAAAIQKMRKRDGRLVRFDPEKIAVAINKAFAATCKGGQEDTAWKLTEEVVSILEAERPGVPDVEHVQDVVEKVLMDSGYVQTAKAYILYRDERSRAREMNSRLMKAYEDITFSGAAERDAAREAAGTAMAAMLRYGSEGAKQFYQMFVLKPEHAKAHREGDIHIQDLDFYTLTTACCQIDIQKLFEGGFSVGRSHLREPDDIASCSALACIAIQANQNDQHGGQSIPRFDYGMAEGVAKTFEKRYTQNLAKCLTLLLDLPEDPEPALRELRQAVWAEEGRRPRLGDGEDYLARELPALRERYPEAAVLEKAQQRAMDYAAVETDRAVYQAMEAFIRGLNAVCSRAGARLPASSVNYGTDTSPEGRMVIKNLLLAAEAGLGGREAPAFPVQIFRVKEGVNYNPGDPNYDLFQLACRCSAKGAFPGFAFQDAPFNLQYYDPARPETEIAYMGCRTRVISNVYDPGRQQCGGRGGLSLTSLNLPRVAIRAKGDVDAFFDELERKMDLCVDQLLHRLEIQSRKKALDYPFLMGQGVWLDGGRLQQGEEVREVLKHGALSMGFVGLSEALTALTGEHHGQSQRSQRLGLEIVARMRARMDEECTKTGLNFTLLATPAEGLSGRFAAIDKGRFGEIPGVTDRDAYTDSFLLPAGFPVPAQEKIRLEAPYHALTNGGHICRVETGGALAEGPAAVEMLVRRMKEAGVGFGSVSPSLEGPEELV